MKESELKKLGIQNSRDRATMLSSLANFRSTREASSPGKLVSECVPDPVCVCVRDTNCVPKSQ